MNRTNFKILILAVTILICCTSFKNPVIVPVTNKQKLAAKYYKTDASWYLANVPFFECSDKKLEEVYYYRWKLYKAHIRNVSGKYGYVVTEFIDDVDWDNKPFGTINAAVGHHILEGRWIKDSKYLDGYINFMYQGGGNDRRYSENMAYATFARYQVNGDSEFVRNQINDMKRVYAAWDDRYDANNKLYYIKPTNDASEYAIASIEASNEADGWGGDAFRPTINSYMYANAQAISKIAALQGNPETSREFEGKASELKATINRELWNDKFNHYCDRYQVNNNYVKYRDFIPGRELAGYVPWQYDIPENTPESAVAWRHLMDTTELSGKYGLRTVEPSYRFYMKPYRYKAGETPECQWNGPSWPYQTAQALSGMANLLNNYTQDVVHKTDYIKLLHQYARQHYLHDGTLDLQEDYDPDKGIPLVGRDRSHHYNHSTYNDLIITGLCGVHPSEGNVLEIKPLVDGSIKYFRLTDMQYHGHKITIVYDADGSRYMTGKGLKVMVDGKKVRLSNKNGKYTVEIGSPVLKKQLQTQSNLAVNLTKKEYPIPSASVNSIPDSLYKAIDGRIIYFPEVKNWWSTIGSKTTTDWYKLDYGEAKRISTVKVFLVADDKMYRVPTDIIIEYRNEGQWIPIPIKSKTPATLAGNTVNTVSFNALTTTQIRVVFKHGLAGSAVAMTELECY